jgi:hypothetical protein
VPHRSKLGSEETPFEGKTNYSENFTGVLAPPVRSARPAASAFRSEGAFDGISTNHHDFPKWDQKPRLPFKPRPNQLNNQADDRNFQTTGAAAFNDKGYQVRRSRKPQASALAQSEPFTATSMASEHFPRWEGARPAEPFKPKSTSHLQADETRDWKTEKSVAFRPRQMQAPERAQAPPSVVLDSAPFEGQSMHRSDFPEYQGAKPSKPFVPSRSKLGSEEIPFEGHSNYSENFTGAMVPPRRSAKPETHNFEPSGKFDATSENRYQRGPVFLALTATP